jgi:hypothetical protein
MKPVWMVIVFFLVYGLFSMKTQAAEGVFAAHAENQKSWHGWKSTFQGE